MTYKENADKKGQTIWDEKEFQYSFEYEVTQKVNGVETKEVIKQSGNILRPIDKSRKYPVLYLLHGLGNAGEWQGQKVQCLMNEWIEKYNLQPMVVVLPNIPKNHTGNYKSSEFKAYIENGLFMKVVDYISKVYKDDILEGAENTAIAGLSAGGTVALYVGVLYPDIFMHVGAFSPGPFLYNKTSDGWITNPMKLKLNNDAKAVHFLARSAKEKEFKTCVEQYYSVFTENGTKIDYELINAGKHDFSTFVPEFELFLQRKMFEKVK